MSAPWAGRAARALAAGGSEEVEVLAGHRPPLFDAEGVRAALAPFLAGLAWGAAAFRELVEGTPIDPLAILLRALALGLTLRALLSGRRFVARLRTWLAAPRHALAIAPEGLLLRTPAGDLPVPRADVLAVRERGHWQERTGARRWTDVYVVLRPPGGRLFLALPPLFDRTPGVLAERLMRWQGPVEGPAENSYPAPTRLASKVYDDAARGVLGEGVVAVRHGHAWRKRGPYATVLLGLVVVEGFLRLGPEAWSRMGLLLPGAVALALVAVPLAWTWLTRRAIGPRKGLALVMTPAEMLMRTRAGVLRATWKGLSRLSIESKPTWSILEGYHQARTLVIERGEEPPIRYDEAFLGVPAEVVLALGEAYRKGQVRAHAG